jgi:hypothetical protein
VSRYKVFKWPGIYPGIVILLTALARSGHLHSKSVMVVGTGCKNRDKLITPTIRVRCRINFKTVKMLK